MNSKNFFCIILITIFMCVEQIQGLPLLYNYEGQIFSYDADNCYDYVEKSLEIKIFSETDLEIYIRPDSQYFYETYSVTLQSLIVNGKQMINPNIPVNGCAHLKSGQFGFWYFLDFSLNGIEYRLWDEAESADNRYNKNPIDFFNVSYDGMIYMGRVWLADFSSLQVSEPPLKQMFYVSFFIIIGMIFIRLNLTKHPNSK